jgi:ADP-heptose:LPS heptosyltransferase
MDVILRNHQLLGDTLMMTSAVRDFKKGYDCRIKVDTNFPGVWDNNPHLSVFDGFEKDLSIGPRIVTQGSKTNGLHFTTAFRVSIESQLNIKITQGPHRPEIFLSEKEKHPPFDFKYWLFNPDCGPYDTKRWNKWQQLIDALDVRLVQVGLEKDCRHHFSDVEDMVGKTDNVRDLFNLVYHSEGCISLVSSLMHIAAAFKKPCVTIAGAREPATFTAYPEQRFLHTIGCLPCARENCCWSCKPEGCIKRGGKIINGSSRCIDMITVQQVQGAVESYYIGGVLKKTSCKAQPPKLLRIVTNAHSFGGAERSVVTIAGMAAKKGYRVEVVARKNVCQEMSHLKYVNTVSAPCDVLLFYTSDMVFDFHKPEFDVFNNLAAKKKVMVLNYKRGQVEKVAWCKNWDKYLFLCSDMADRMLPGENKKVLPPPVDLSAFFEIAPKYEAPLTVLRMNSQGNKKIPVNMADLQRRCNARFTIQTKGDPVKYLSTGNLFWYLLPPGYTDQGPRVIMEAMAAGLPVIAENRDGAKDRVTPDCGWLINSHDEAVEIINGITPEVLRQKGERAKERAKEFQPEKWLEEITK